MKIVSNFRDYYDGVMKMGMDKDIVYVRETSKIDLNKKYNLERFHSGYGGVGTRGSYNVKLIFLGYCGQIFRIYEVDVKRVGESSKKYVFFDWKPFRQFMQENKLGSEYEFNRTRWWPSSYIKFADYDSRKLGEIFHECQVPLFLIESGKDKTQLVLNPKLKSLAFQKVKEPYTAYQDIFQYVSGVLNSPENKMVKIDDEVKVHKHGFDKWSFRKLPGGKKRRK